MIYLYCHRKLIACTVYSTPSGNFRVSTITWSSFTLIRSPVPAISSNIILLFGEVRVAIEEQGDLLILCTIGWESTTLSKNSLQPLGI